MLASRGVCIARRARRHVLGMANINGPKQFSSVAYSAFSSRSSYRLVPPRCLGILPTHAFSCRVSLPPSPRVSSQSQRCFQSSSQHTSSASPTSFDASAPSSEVVMGPLDQIASVGDDATWGIGYLKDAGLDFGWGPSSLVMWIFEHIHVWGGFEVGTSIVVLALLQRFFIFPLIVGAKEQSARFVALAPQMTVLQAEMRAAGQEQDQVRMLKARKAISALQKASGVSYLKMFGPMLQMPLGFGSWRVLRNSAAIPAPGMVTGGFLWFPNLTAPDPYLVLPALTAIFQHLSVRIGNEDGNLSRQGPVMQNLLLYILPSVSFLVTSYAPGAVQLTFTTVAMLSMVTNLLFRNPSFRAMCGVRPRVAIIPNTGQSDRVYKGTINVINKNAKPPPTVNVSKPSKRLSKLNPMNWLKAMDGIQDEASKYVGGAIPSTKQGKKDAEVRRDKERQNKFEAKRAAERERNMKEWRERRKE